VIFSIKISIPFDQISLADQWHPSSTFRHRKNIVIAVAINIFIIGINPGKCRLGLGDNADPLPAT
jgi:hypothetical protein